VNIQSEAIGITDRFDNQHSRIGVRNHKFCEKLYFSLSTCKLLEEVFDDLPFPFFKIEVISETSMHVTAIR
jgi:hypothetical protein